MSVFINAFFLTKYSCDFVNAPEGKIYRSALLPSVCTIVRESNDAEFRAGKGSDFLGLGNKRNMDGLVKAAFQSL